MKHNRKILGALSILLIATMACSLGGAVAEEAEEVQETPTVEVLVVTATPDEAPTPTEEPAAAEPTSSKATATLNQDLNVREGPGTNYRIIIALRGGTTLDILGKNANGSWWLIGLPSGGSGWVSSGFTTSVNTSSVPVVSAPPAPSTSGDSGGDGGGGSGDSGGGSGSGGGTGSGSGGGEQVAPPDSDISVTLNIKTGSFTKADAVSYPNGDTTDKVFVKVNGFDSVKTSGDAIYTLTCNSTGGTPTVTHVGGAIKSGSASCNSTWRVFYTNVSTQSTITIQQGSNGYTTWTLFASAAP